MRIYREDLLSRQEAVELLIADGWDEIGAEVILDTAEEQEYWLNKARLMQLSADYKDR